MHICFRSGCVAKKLWFFSQHLPSSCYLWLEDIYFLCISEHKQGVLCSKNLILSLSMLRLGIKLTRVLGKKETIHEIFWLWIVFNGAHSVFDGFEPLVGHVIPFKYQPYYTWDLESHCYLGSHYGSTFLALGLSNAYLTFMAINQPEKPWGPHISINDIIKNLNFQNLSFTYGMHLKWKLKTFTI